MSQKKRVHPIIQETDLLSISRASDRCRTSVSIRIDWDWQVQWLLFGACNILALRDGRQHYLEGRAVAGLTDFEHDAVVLVRLPLIGLMFDKLMVHGHTTHLVGWVASSDEEADFRVPRPGYDPANHKDAFTCEDQRCAKEPHRIVPEGSYIPRFDRELYEAVKGREVEILIGPAF